MVETMLTLKTGVKLIEPDGQFGLMLNGRTQYAKDSRQAEMIRALTKHSLSPESLMALLSAGNDPRNDNDISLAIAEFILDFGEWLKA